MTIATTDAAPSVHRISVFARISAFFVAYGDAQWRRDRITALNALSDAELGERGLTRDGIVRHVFADKLYL